MRLPRECLDCSSLTAPGKSRCPDHERAKRKVWDRGSAAKRHQRMASGDGAAARLRSRIKRAGGSCCTQCGDFYPHPVIEIDHPLALHLGGRDVDDNVTPMCQWCHQAKTSAERRKQGIGPL